MLFNTHVDVYIGFSECKESAHPMQKVPYHAIDDEYLQVGERGSEMAQEISNIFPNIVALEREPMLLLGSLLLQLKDIVNNRKERKCKERADVRAVESTGINTELALQGQTPSLQWKSGLLSSN